MNSYSGEIINSSVIHNGGIGDPIISEGPKSQVGKSTVDATGYDSGFEENDESQDKTITQNQNTSDAKETCKHTPECLCVCDDTKVNKQAKIELYEQSGSATLTISDKDVLKTIGIQKELEIIIRGKEQHKPKTTSGKKSKKSKSKSPVVVPVVAPIPIQDNKTQEEVITTDQELAQATQLQQIVEKQQLKTSPFSLRDVSKKESIVYVGCEKAEKCLCKVEAQPADITHHKLQQTIALIDDQRAEDHSSSQFQLLRQNTEEQCMTAVGISVKPVKYIEHMYEQQDDIMYMVVDEDAINNGIKKLSSQKPNTDQQYQPNLLNGAIVRDAVANQQKEFSILFSSMPDKNMLLRQKMEHMIAQETLDLMMASNATREQNNAQTCIECTQYYVERHDETYPRRSKGGKKTEPHLLDLVGDKEEAKSLIGDLGNLHRKLQNANKLKAEDKGHQKLLEESKSLLLEIADKMKQVTQAIPTMSPCARSVVFLDIYSAFMQVAKRINSYESDNDHVPLIISDEAAAALKQMRLMMLKNSQSPYKCVHLDLHTIMQPLLEQMRATVNTFVASIPKMQLSHENEQRINRNNQLVLEMLDDMSTHHCQVRNTVQETNGQIVRLDARSSIKSSESGNRSYIVGSFNNTYENQEYREDKPHIVFASKREAHEKVATTKATKTSEEKQPSLEAAPLNRKGLKDGFGTTKARTINANKPQNNWADQKPISAKPNSMPLAQQKTPMKTTNSLAVIPEPVPIVNPKISNKTNTSTTQKKVDSTTKAPETKKPDNDAKSQPQSTSATKQESAPKTEQTKDSVKQSTNTTSKHQTKESEPKQKPYAHGMNTVPKMSEEANQDNSWIKKEEDVQTPSKHKSTTSKTKTNTSSVKYYGGSATSNSNSKYKVRTNRTAELRLKKAQEAAGKDKNLIVHNNNHQVHKS